MNLAHLKAHVLRHAPLDLDAGRGSNPHPRLGGHHPIRHGRASLSRAPRKEWIDVLVASASLPLVTRGKVKFRGTWMFDGGYSDPLPLDKALEFGGQNILVVRTRPVGDHISQSTWIHFVPTGTGMTRRWCLCLKRPRAVQRHGGSAA